MYLRPLGGLPGLAVLEPYMFTSSIPANSVASDCSRSFALCFPRKSSALSGDSDKRGYNTHAILTLFIIIAYVYLWLVRCHGVIGDDDGIRETRGEMSYQKNLY